jgi:4'-phosphopantetheinyl transferase
LAQNLDPNETARAARFYFDRDRRQFILARGVLRCLLGSHLGVRPRDVRLCYGSHGKPRVECSLAFSVAHSAGFVAIAIGSVGDIGIDVEKKSILPSKPFESLQRLHGAKRLQGSFAAARWMVGLR